MHHQTLGQTLWEAYCRHRLHQAGLCQREVLLLRCTQSEAVSETDHNVQ